MSSRVRLTPWSSGVNCIGSAHTSQFFRILKDSDCQCTHSGEPSKRRKLKCKRRTK